MGIIFGLSSLPGSAVPGRFGSTGHFVLYAVLGALFMLALPKTQPLWKWAALAVLLASVYGVTDEFHQSFVPGRMPDVLDWVVDTAGALTSVGVLAAWQARRGGEARDAC